MCSTQLIRPGMPVCYGGIPHAFDMRTMHERCVEMKDEILRDHVPDPLDEDVSRELDKIVDAARRHLS